MLYIQPVFCRIVLVRKAGAPVPRWQMGSLPVFHGNLVVKEEHQAALGRSSRIAELVPREAHGARHRLLDVVLLGTSSTWLTLSGLERVEQGDSYADCAQTWHVTPCNGNDPAE